jgi:hypothetical protein
MASDKVIGGPLDSGVLKQLDIRKGIMSTPYRDDNNLRYLAARTGWVKLTSSVQVNGTNDLAKKYILIGGTYDRVGENTYSNFPNGKGFRPMPGITGVDIKAINRFGLLKEATITYNCWDVSQLQELEVLFMRPGFSVLLEWGHSLYYTTGTNLVTVPQTIKTFFDAGTTKEQLYDEIDKLKASSGQNYDAIYGFIKNFSWSFRADGGYDCTTVVTSIGEIIESLQIDSDNPFSEGGSAEETQAKTDELVQAKKRQAKKASSTNPEPVATEPTPLEYIAIGDSQTVYLTGDPNTVKLIGDRDGNKNLHKTGWNLQNLVNAVGEYKESPAVKGIVISIGTNDGFTNIGNKALTLKAAIDRIFPNVQKILVVKGSWGWGEYLKAATKVDGKYVTGKDGKIIGITREMVDTYYESFTKAGFTVINPAIGDMTNKGGNPHNPKLAIYSFIRGVIDQNIK